MFDEYGNYIPPPPPPGPAYDEEYLRMLLEQGVPAPMPTDIDREYVDEQGAWLTDMSKGSNMGTDLDYLIMNNMLDPSAYDPIQSLDYDNVPDAPGRRRMQQMMGGSAYEQFLAQELSNPGSSPEMALSLVRDLIEDDPQSAIALSAPRVIDFNTGQVQEDIDYKNVYDTARELQTSVGSDPTNIQYDDQGNPYVSSFNDSPAAKALMEAGFTTTPGQTYDPYSLTADPQGTYDWDMRAAEAVPRAEEAQRAAQQRYLDAFDPNPETLDQRRVARDLPGFGWAAGRQSAPDLRTDVAGMPEGEWNTGADMQAYLAAQKGLRDFTMKPPIGDGRYNGNFQLGEPSVIGDGRYNGNFQLGEPRGQLSPQQQEMQEFLAPPSPAEQMGWNGVPGAGMSDPTAAATGLGGFWEKLKGGQGGSGWGIGDRTVGGGGGRGGSSSGWAGRVNEAISRKAPLMIEKERLGRRINEQSIANARKRQSAEDVKRAGYVARRSQDNQANRQAMVEAMMAQGRSPFQDELNRRNRSIYGM